MFCFILFWTNERTHKHRQTIICVLSAIMQCAHSLFHSLNRWVIILQWHKSSSSFLVCNFTYALRLKSFIQLWHCCIDGHLFSRIFSHVFISRNQLFSWRKSFFGSFYSAALFEQFFINLDWRMFPFYLVRKLAEDSIFGHFLKKK